MVVRWNNGGIIGVHDWKLTLPRKVEFLALVENTDKESRHDRQASACAAHAGIQAGGGSLGPGRGTDLGGGQGIGHTQGEPGQLGEVGGQGGDCRGW